MSDIGKGRRCRDFSGVTVTEVVTNRAAQMDLELLKLIGFFICFFFVVALRAVDVCIHEQLKTNRNCVWSSRGTRLQLAHQEDGRSYS